MSRAKRVFSIVLPAFACVIIVLCLFLAAVPGERFVKGIAESRLGSVLDREVRIGKLETNLFSRLLIEDVSVFRVDRGDSVPFVSIDRCRIDYDFLDLFKKHFRVTALELERLAVSVRRDSAGVLDLPAFGGPRREGDGSGRGFSLAVERAVVRDARLRYRDEGSGAGGHLDGVEIEMRRTGEGTYDYHVRTGGGEVSYGTVLVPIEILRFDGTAGARIVTLDSLTVLVPGVACRGSGALTVRAESPAVSCDLRISGDLGRMAGLAGRFVPEALEPVGGALELSLRLEGTAARPHLDVRGGFEKVRLAGILIDGGSMGVTVDPDTIRLGELTLSLLGGTVACSGEAVTDGAAGFRMQAAVEGISLERILHRVHGVTPPYRGRVYGTLSVRGSIDELPFPEVHAAMRVRDVEYRGRPVADIAVDVDQRRGRYEIRFEHEAGGIEAAGGIEGDRLDGRFTVSIRDLEPLAELLGLSDLSGGLRASGVVIGDYRAPEIRADFTGGALAYRHFPVDTVAGSLLYRDKTVRLDDCTMRGSAAPVDTVHPPFGVVGLTGRFSYDVRVHGTVPELEGDLTADLEEFGLGGARIEGGRLHIVYAGRRVSLETLELRADSTLVRVTGAYNLSSGGGSAEIDLLRHRPGVVDSARSAPDPDFRGSAENEYPAFGRMSIAFAARPGGQYSVRVDGRRIDAAPVRCFYRAIPDVGGLIDLGLDADGTRTAPRLSCRFNMLNPRYQRFTVDSIAGVVSLTGRTVELQELDIHDRGHRTRVTAALELAGEGGGGFTVSRGSPFRGRISGGDFDLGLLDPVLAPNMAVRGSGSFDLAWDGTVASPRPAGSVVVTGGSIRMHDKAPEIRAINLNAVIEDSILTVRSLNGYLRQTPFLARGVFGIGDGGGAGYAGACCVTAHIELDLGGSRALEGEGYLAADSVSFSSRMYAVDLSLFQPFVPALERLAGTIDGGLEVSGPTRMPRIDGRLAIRGLSLYHAGLGQSISDGTVAVTFDRRTVVVDTLAVRVGEGAVAAAGTLTHRGTDLERVDLGVEADALRIILPKKIDLRLRSARLTYRTEGTNHILDGDVVLGETRFIANFKPQSVLPFTRSVERPEREMPPFLAMTRLNIRLRESDDIWVDNNLARLRVHPELNIVGNPSRPNVAGRLTVVEGYVLFLDRKFSIERGVVDFIDPDRLNPIVDIEARTTVKTYRAMEARPYDVTLTVYGPLDEAVTTLVSDPPLERPDIVTLLTLGVTRTELTGTSETGGDISMRGVLVERAQSLTSQRVSSYISRNVGGLFGLDQISIEGNLFRFDDSWGPELIAAKRFSSRVEVTYRTNIGHLNERNIRLDYRLTRRFSIQGETDQYGRSGLDLKFGLKFR
ncbi:MAG TPA: translocation/assembly module TamB domain-containing protein [Patescibacteria group bacterium]|nr:translocation/assembly module TamB domain-containing protein [Patescibacteria group bacterium]